MGQGTTFTIYLPALRGALPDDQPLIPSTVPPAHGELILVVEDSAILRKAIANTLELLNYRTLEAANGHEALAILEQHATEIALILSDMVMPEMGGHALFHTLQERSWRAPMVIMTGHPMERELHDLRVQGLAGWLLKPPTVEDLATTIARALHGEHPDA